jgi:hypothetical protein
MVCNEAKIIINLFPLSSQAPIILFLVGLTLSLFFISINAGSTLSLLRKTTQGDKSENKNFLGLGFFTTDFALTEFCFHVRSEKTTTWRPEKNSIKKRRGFSRRFL